MSAWSSDSAVKKNMNKVKTKTNILGCCWPISAAVEAGGDAVVFSAVMQ